MHPGNFKGVSKKIMHFCREKGGLTQDNRVQPAVPKSRINGKH